ncbi:E3 ubiquitin-protein ligase UPL6 isoform X2 [Aristolochia californica]|uniref:E3 ubiquitin-protein ligase UPL6 isoform X2 n=1 Tax=Aristolochia californica TaxID=171875 RepID=UPI0035E297DD
MFFSGEASTRRRVDLGGRSSKERDRQKLLEQTRLERKRRFDLRQQNSAALKIQKCFRGRRAVEVARATVREHFCISFGSLCQKVDRNCFGPNSGFLRELLFFFNAQNNDDFSLLVETCRLLQYFAQGDVVSLFAGADYPSNSGIAEHRVKKLALTCLQAVHRNRDRLKAEILISLDSSTNTPTGILLGAVLLLINPRVPWVCKVIGYLLQKNSFALLRDIVLTGAGTRKQVTSGKISFVEHVLTLMASHVGQHPCSCSQNDPRLSFSSQILTIPFLWQHFPLLKEVFGTLGLSGYYLHQIASCVRGYSNVLPHDISPEFPGYACLLGNMAEIAGAALSAPHCSFDMAQDFAAVATCLLEALPPLRSYSKQMDEDEMDVDVEVTWGVLNEKLEHQISNAIDSRLLHQLVNVLFSDTSSLDGSRGDATFTADVVATGAVCSFLHVVFSIFPLERIMPVLAYRTKLVLTLWNYMKRCHESQQWPSLSVQTSCLSGDAPGWILPLVVFCPVYKYMLMLLDNEEFYEQEKPLSLKDIRGLIIILRQALWDLLWVIPTRSPISVKATSNLSARKRLSVDFIQHRVGIVISELLTQLQDWNNRQQFTSPTDFHAQEAVDEIFVTQAVVENTRAYDILRQAPFLVPFTSRVKIFTSQLAAARQRDGHHGGFVRNQFRIRRDHIFEDAFNQLSALSDDELRGLIRVTFVNEFGVEEAGIDGGGIFKDFMENIARSTFDVQYGLFKETTDHLLYPNPGSGLVHEQHLQNFHFLGCLLGKAMFEGILVDIPFATFFLRALKEKKNFLNDLPSLDPELYRHLLFLKHYEGDLSDLELYFVIVSNEYGEQKEEELIAGGKDIRVTNKNVREFIHYVAHYRLNHQIISQSKHFLRGFQKLIRKDWMDMFNEHELQLLISGSLEGLDVDDLHTHAHYTGGYSEEHYVIAMFWEVLKSFSFDDQKKFLKFVTGCSRGPLLGFKFLEPQFCIQRAAAADASEEYLDRLPTSATCMNLLKLPPYRSKEQLQMKLIYAINADAGFDLS